MSQATVGLPTELLTVGTANQGPLAGTRFPRKCHCVAMPPESNHMVFGQELHNDTISGPSKFYKNQYYGGGLQMDHPDLC